MAPQAKNKRQKSLKVLEGSAAKQINDGLSHTPHVYYPFL